VRRSAVSALILIGLAGPPVERLAPKDEGKKVERTNRGYRMWADLR